MLTYLVLQATSFIHHGKKAPPQAHDKQAISNSKANPFQNDAKSKTPPYKGGPRARELCALAP